MPWCSLAASACGEAMKSSSANVGADALAAQCRELEALGRSGNVAAAAPVLAQLDAELARVRAALEAQLTAGVADACA